MRILYAAIDQVVPGTLGGSTHVQAVAEGLAALGHDVHVAVRAGLPAPGNGPTWHDVGTPLGSPNLRLLRRGRLRALATALRPDVVIERYHNFGGEAIRAAAGIGAVAVLEVNAPVIDHPGSPKALLDRLLLVQPMRRWRDALCRRADLIVTPNAAIIPASVPRDKIRLLEWGADTDRFRPDAAAHPPYVRMAVTTLALFAGAFRSWHGAMNLVDAIKTLRARGHKEIGAVFIGDGPELPRIRTAARGIDTILITGAIPHDRMPAALASADIGVAPFNLRAHAPLALGFYWSPLKIFEYMATGLPVVAPAVDRIPALVEDGREGVLYDPRVNDALADTLLKLSDPALRKTLGAAARARALRDYSWSAHCQALEEAIVSAGERRGRR